MSHSIQEKLDRCEALMESLSEQMSLPKAENSILSVLEIADLMNQLADSARLYGEVLAEISQLLWGSQSTSIEPPLAKTRKSDRKSNLPRLGQLRSNSYKPQNSHRWGL